MNIKMLDGVVLNRHNQQIISTQFSWGDNSLDVLELPLYRFDNCQPLHTGTSKFQYNLPVISDNSQILLGTSQVDDPMEALSPWQILSDNNHDILRLDPQEMPEAPQGAARRSAHIAGKRVNVYQW